VLSFAMSQWIKMAKLWSSGLLGLTWTYPHSSDPSWVLKAETFPPWKSKAMNREMDSKWGSFSIRRKEKEAKGSMRGRERVKWSKGKGDLFILAKSKRIGLEERSVFCHVSVYLQQKTEGIRILRMQED